MLNTKLARKNLTQKERKHLSQTAGINTMAQMERQVELMKKQKAENGIPCFDCLIAAKKLGMITD